MNDSNNWREERRKRRDAARERWRTRFEARYQNMESGEFYRQGRMWTGIFILLIGVAVLIDRTTTGLPEWLISWQTFLIALGLFIGVKHQFRNVAWLVLILVGSAFLLPEINPELNFRPYVWPAVLIIVGAFIILRPRRCNWDDSETNDSQKKSGPAPDIEEAKIVDETSYSKEDFVHTTSVFGGVKKNIISKNFKGGDLVNIFGGSELDLSRSDINGVATVEVTNIFGGTKLIVPSDWSVKSDAAVIFGGIDDKRHIPNDPAATNKTLLIKGTVIFGGVDIKSY